MFSSAFLEQETIQTQDNMLPFCSSDPFILQHLWPSNRLHRDVWIARNVCTLNGLVPGSKAGQGIILLPSVCLSLISIVEVNLSGNAANVKQYVQKDQRSVRTQWQIVPNWPSIIIFGQQMHLWENFTLSCSEDNHTHNKRSSTQCRRVDMQAYINLCHDVDCSDPSIHPLLNMNIRASVEFFWPQCALLQHLNSCSKC